MKHTLKRVICCVLSIVMVIGSSISAFAVDTDASNTPVIVINDIEANPLVNTDDGTVVFDFNDYEFDILFTTAFSSDISDLFSKEVIEQIKNNELTAMEIITILGDYLGFSGDITKISNKVIEIAMELINYIDLSNMDIKAIIAGIDYKGLAQALKDKITSRIDNLKLIKMNDDGTPANANIGALAYPESLEYYFDEDSDAAYKLAGEIGTGMADAVGYENTYVFTYDWRLDPIANAASLNDYIENVKSETGASKVSVISEGYGSTVATTYLAEYEDSAADSVLNFVTVSSEFSGSSVVGDFFKGSVVNQFSNLTNYTSAYIRWTNDISDNAITSFSTWLTNYILNRNWEAQAFCLHVEEAIAELNFFIRAMGITADMAKMPGLWALVPVEDYEDAVENIYGANVDESYIEKLTAYKLHQDNYEDILTTAKGNGINISIVAAWDLQILPIGENSSVQSDGIVDTAYASFGATCVPLNNVAQAMNVEQYGDVRHDHLSSTYDMLTPAYAFGGICHYIDASTCALPENTWFIKNMKHNTFTTDSNSMEFLVWLITANEERTVWQNAAYQQFMNYNRFVNPGKLSSSGIVATDPSQGTYLLGDMNLDGKVTAIDARIALRVAAGLEYIEFDSLQFKNGDVYPDGVINAADARKILLMSSALIDYMTSGIELEYKTDAGILENSAYSIELTPNYNSITNTLELSLTLLNAKDSYSGNFIVKYDKKMFTYSGVDTTVLKNGYVVAGRPVDEEGTLTCGFSVDKAIAKSDCDANGNLLLATFKLDVSRKEVNDASITAGASHFYEDNQETFLAPVSIDLDKDFFFMLGDADNNRYITASDARTILRIAARLENITDEGMFIRCDVDCDGKITATDARLALRAAAKLIDTYK